VPGGGEWAEKVEGGFVECFARKLSDMRWEKDGGLMLISPKSMPII